MNETALEQVLAPHARCPPVIGSKAPDFEARITIGGRRLDSCYGC